MFTSLTEELLDLTSAERGHGRVRLALTLSACCCSSCCTCFAFC